MYLQGTINSESLMPVILLAEYVTPYLQLAELFEKGAVLGAIDLVPARLSRVFWVWRWRRSRLFIRLQLFTKSLSRSWSCWAYSEQILSYWLCAELASSRALRAIFRGEALLRSDFEFCWYIEDRTRTPGYRILYLHNVDTQKQAIRSQVWLHSGF